MLAKSPWRCQYPHTPWMDQRYKYEGTCNWLVVLCIPGCVKIVNGFLFPHGLIIGPLYANPCWSKISHIIRVSIHFLNIWVINNAIYFLLLFLANKDVLEKKCALQKTGLPLNLPCLYHLYFGNRAFNSLYSNALTFKMNNLVGLLRKLVLGYAIT